MDFFPKFFKYIFFAKITFLSTALISKDSPISFSCPSVSAVRSALPAKGAPPHFYTHPESSQDRRFRGFDTLVHILVSVFDTMTSLMIYLIILDTLSFLFWASYFLQCVLAPTCFDSFQFASRYAQERR